MSTARSREDRPTLTVRHPTVGMKVARVGGDRPLMRGIPNHFGTSIQIMGRSHWTSGGAEWSSAPGNVSVKVPGEVSIERAREGEIAFQTVLFDEALIDEAQLVLDRPIMKSRIHAIDPRDQRARPLFALHRKLLGAEPDFAIEEAMCNAVHALVDIVCAPRGATFERTRFSAAVARARAFLDERFTETIGLDALAAHARLDKFRLCRAFSEQVGLPPHAYVTHRRITRAQELLARGMSQAEVATSVGFYDQSLMHRHFKRILRLTPGAFARAAAFTSPANIVRAVAR